MSENKMRKSVVILCSSVRVLLQEKCPLGFIEDKKITKGQS